MDKMFFLRHYGILLSAKSVLIDTDVAELTYQAYRDDFTDEEFAAVCMAVLKNENFYGRPPDPAIFAKYVKASAAETDFIACKTDKSVLDDGVLDARGTELGAKLCVFIDRDSLILYKHSGSGAAELVGELFDECFLLLKNLCAWHFALSSFV